MNILAIKITIKTIIYQFIRPLGTEEQDIKYKPLPIKTIRNLANNIN
ncbi:hypothetical protein NIES4102_04160 [Chondrocystis sp. NIES-4102]|nr:hypothetical protein NIES4102_04160 [Chondrocystis sp. NIES-4102]